METNGIVPIQVTIKDLYDTFINLHKSQFTVNNIPEVYWTTILDKIKDEVFDAGDFFQIIIRSGEDDEFIGLKAVMTNEDGVKCSNKNGIFLVDHAWTYRINEAREHLAKIDGLIDRMSSLMHIDQSEQDGEDGETRKNRLIDEVTREMWKYNQTYNLSFENMTDEERESLWYIMDEFGSSIRHSDTPNVKCSPFYYLPTRTMYTLMWPLCDLNYNDEITRDYAYGVKDEELRRAKLVPWFDTDCTDISTEQLEPGDDYFMMAREDEKLPKTEDVQRLQDNPPLVYDEARVYKVYTDIELVREFLTDRAFTLVHSESEADIIFIKRHFKNYRYLAEKKPNTLINQYPFENVVTVKDLLAIVCRRACDSDKWLPITYNLKYELAKFVSFYQKREQTGEDNYWIVKPWNLARSIDTYVTNDLNQIIRLQESSPKIVCKYITNPVLFYRDELCGKVKFDIRYVIMVRSVQPLTIYTYNVFWLRFANKPYSLEDLHDYEKHFTVMNYRPVNLKQIDCDEFMPLFEQQNPDYKWSDIQSKIFEMIRKVFEGATSKEPPKGFMNNPQSRSMYAIDLMLDWREDGQTKTIEPMICEINYLPDCTRACKYHPSFFNDIFHTLFLDNSQGRPVTRVC